MRYPFSFFLMIVFAFVHSVMAREWVDRTGKYKTVADFVRVKDNKVTLKKSDGTFVSVPIGRLSKQDQDYIREVSKTGSAATSDQSSDEHTSGPTDLPRGTLFDEDFEPVVVEMEGDRITFASDDDFFPAKSIQLFLFLGDKKLAGHKMIVRPDARGQLPHVHLKSKKPPKTEIIFDGYSMRLTFGQKQGNTISGTIDLKIPKHQTTLSGTLVVEEPKNYKLSPTTDDAPFIVANLEAPPSASDKNKINAGYIGVSVGGKQISNMAGTNWGESGHVSSLSFKPRVTSVILDNRDITAQHISLEPGKYFHYFVWDNSYLVGKWVDVQADSQVKLSLKMDLADVGSLEVETSGDDDMKLVPLELSEKSKELKLSTHSLAFQLGLSAEPKDGKAIFKAACPGKYVLVTEKGHEQIVEIKSGTIEKVKVDLQP